MARPSGILTWGRRKAVSQVKRAHKRGRCAMTSKSLSLIALALASVVAARPGFAQQPIRIGASIAVTGRDKVQGGYVREGYLLCQKHVNEKGGVLGLSLIHI